MICTWCKLSIDRHIHIHTPNQPQNIKYTQNKNNQKNNNNNKKQVPRLTESMLGCVEFPGGFFLGVKDDSAADPDARCVVEQCIYGEGGCFIPSIVSSIEHTTTMYR